MNETLMGAEYFYFGAASELFGAYYVPGPEDGRRTGIVIVPPIGGEHIRSHRAVSRLAAGLAREGFHVLMFDPYGCGDSLGELTDASVSCWIDNLRTAHRELKCIAGTTCGGTVGVRFGATLAAMYVRCQTSRRCSVLWEPVLDGRQYVAQMQRAQSQWLERSSTSYRQIRRPHELDGSEWSATLLQEIERLHVGLTPPAEDERRLIVHSDDCAALGTSAPTDRGDMKASQEVWLPGTNVWEPKGDDLGKALVPVEVLEYTVRWCAKMAE